MSVNELRILIIIIKIPFVKESQNRFFHAGGLSGGSISPCSLVQPCLQKPSTHYNLKNNVSLCIPANSSLQSQVVDKSQQNLYLYIHYVLIITYKHTLSHVVIS